MGGEKGAPGKTGFHMLVYANGRTLGTVGGGKLEATVREEALQSLQDKKPNLLEYTLDEHKAQTRLVRPVEVKISIFLEPLVGRPTLYIFGDGYIALSLSEFARTLEFSVVVVDDREEFANQTRFPEAEVRLGNFVNLTRTLEFNEDDSIVIVTRGHEHDEEVLKECLSKAIQPRYIGMIGSKEKVAATFNHLKEQGIKEDLLRQVKAPTGLELGSEARRKSHSA